MSFVKHRGGSLLDNLPVLTELAEPGSQVILPTLTEIIHQEAEPLPVEEIKPDIIDETILLQRLELHLEQVFEKKLNRMLEHYQRQAVALAVKELKTELPELLREAMKGRL